MDKLTRIEVVMAGKKPQYYFHYKKAGKVKVNSEEFFAGISKLLTYERLPY